MRQTVTASDGVSISYRTFGSGPLSVLFVHGWMVSGAVFDDLIETLGTDGIRLIVPDQRGTGSSDRPEKGYDLAQYARDLEAVADHAQAQRFAVVGSSMGGQLALLLAATRPERVSGGVLLCPVPPSGAPLPPEMKELFRTSGGNRDKQRIILQNVCKELSDATCDRLLDDAGKIPPACIEQAFDAWTAGFTDDVAAIRAPMLVVGTDDPALPMDFLRQAIVERVQGAGMSYLPGPGHYPHVERPRETAAVVRAFLTALLR
ncbi:MAG: alpha/beta hydrolase [Myxococcales bacterium 68-20]|nr:alpha/beta hydrolase [Myxococcales bacterium]OJY22366.1 MAG: alpha/beta hydrolase [Myxococcales bacterium 68-20]